MHLYKKELLKNKTFGIYDIPHIRAENFIFTQKSYEKSMCIKKIRIITNV